MENTNPDSSKTKKKRQRHKVKKSASNAASSTETDTAAAAEATEIPQEQPQPDEQVTRTDEAVGTANSGKKKKKSCGQKEPVVQPTNSVSTSASTSSSTLTTNSEVSQDPQPTDAAVSTLLLWSRQENSCNHATEENHNNFKSEKSVQGTNASTSAVKPAVPNAEKTKKPEKPKNSVTSSSKQQPEPSDPYETKSNASNLAEQKTKLQLRAEQKSALDALLAQAKNDNSPATTSHSQFRAADVVDGEVKRRTPLRSDGKTVFEAWGLVPENKTSIMDSKSSQIVENVVIDREVNSKVQPKAQSNVQKVPKSNTPSSEVKVERSGNSDTTNNDSKTKAQLKAERKAAFEAQRPSQNETTKELSLTPGNSDGTNTESKTKAQLKAERKAAFEAQRPSQNETPKEQLSLIPAKTKAELKAERRAIQEAQRANKDVKQDKTPLPNKVEPVVATAAKSKSASPEKVGLTGPAKKPSADIKKGSRKLRLFSHLPQHVTNENLTSKMNLLNGEIHPAVVSVGLKTSQGVIKGSNARCIAILGALSKVIAEYITPPQKELSRDLDAKLQPNIDFLNKCRPLSVSTTNALKKLRYEITQVPSSKVDADAIKDLIGVIDTFVEEDINIAKKSISQYAGKKIFNNDVVLVYAYSSLVKQVLIDAHAAGKKFRVIVVDSRPGLEGRELLRSLVKNGISCTYIWINAISYVMKEVTKVILGCHSLQANGCVVSRVGSSQVALVAHASNVPVLICCETYKFCDRVHTDSFVYNELGDTDALMKASKSLSQDLPLLNPVCLTYDVMPSHLVTSVITELQMLPCTSVPVVLRVKHLAQEM